MAGEASLVVYANNPFGDLSMHERSPAYVPVLMRTWLMKTKWNRFISSQIDTTNQSLSARQFVMTRQIYGRPNFSPKTPMTLFFPPGTFAGLEQKTVGLEYHYDSVQIHRDTDLFNYLNATLETMARGALGWNLIQYGEFLARRAAMDSSYNLMADGSDGVAPDFSVLTSATTHKFDLRWVNQVILGMEEEYIIDTESGGPRMACLTTPGVIYDISTQAGSEWIAINSLGDAGYGRLNTYGVSGAYKGVVFIPVPVNKLRCVGPVEAQTTIAAPINTLDGCLSTANAQGFIAKQSGAAEYIQVASAAGIVAGDEIVIHRTRTSDYTVSNGVDPNEGTADYRVVASVDGNNISLTEPWLKEPYDTVVAGTSHYGWVTLAAHVHMSSFVADVNAIQIGVAQQIQLVEAPPIDNMMKMRRFSWDGHFKYELMNHPGVRNIYTRGAFTVPGSMGVDG